jgi:RNA polymerase sigma factor (sigma-70 family)
MGTAPIGLVVRHLRRAALSPCTSGPTDGELLEWFITRRDGDAFAALVRRHGPMVLGVCRRIVGNVHDAEDAFQATFLVLVRKADALGERDLVGSWLYGVACRTAMKARTVNARRRQMERQLVEVPHPAVAEDGPRDDWRPLLDRELSRLPEIYRLPVVLCELEGRSRREVARQLRLPEGTLSSRLAKARRLLARRMARHGPAFSAAVLAALAQGTASARVPPSLLNSTVAAAGAGTLPVHVVALAEGVVRAMMLGKLKVTMLVLLVLGLLGTATGLLTAPVLAGKPVDAGPKGLPAFVVGQKEKKEQGPIVHGVVKSVDAGKKTITMAVRVDKTGKKTEEKTFSVADDAKVTLEETFSKKEEPPVGSLADLSAGTGATLQLDVEGKKVVAISARGPGLHGNVKSVDQAKNTITVTSKDSGKLGEHTVEIVKEAKIIKDDGLGKKGDTPKEGTLADLTEGTPVHIQLSVNRKKALGVHIHGQTLNGTLKAYDAGNKALTVTVKEDAQVVDKDLKLAENARIDGNPTQGDRVSVTLSVHDKGVAAAVRVIKE